jgi:hypothetical protein
VKRIKKEIIRVRRKLALQKGQKASDIEDSADTGLINSNFKKAYCKGCDIYSMLTILTEIVILVLLIQILFSFEQV